MSSGGGDDDGDSRQMWAWAAGIVAVAVVGLVAGSQIARWAGQDVDWYTGFGQWLGAIASILAAAAALWIATSDRRRAARLAIEQRRQDAQEEEVRITRVASLVRVSHSEQALQFAEMPTARIENLRQDTIVDVQVSKFVVAGKNWVDTEMWEIQHVNREPKVDRSAPRQFEHVIQPNSFIERRVWVQDLDDPRYMPVQNPTLVEVTYLDSAGLRWRVDSKGHVERIRDRHDGES